MSKARIGIFIVSMGFAIYFITSGLLGIGSIAEYNTAVEEEQVAKQKLAAAEKDLAYEYGRCVFYDRVPIEECNRAGPSGFEMYEKYYGDGSWTVEADPDPTTT